MPQQRKALEHIEALADRLSPGARENINAILGRMALNENAYDGAIESVQSHGRVAIHFHPERLCRRRMTVAESLLETGEYQSQFETGLSSGSPTAYTGGERDLWESRLFGGAYHEAEVPSAGRPKYGALHVMDHPDGPAPRFGSCYFLLRPEVSSRCTFTFGGSHETEAVDRTGTLKTLNPVMAPLLAQLERGEGAFGISHLTVSEFLAQLRHGLSKPFRNPRTRPLGRALDSFIEVQIHGGIRLDKDVERLVADPAFQGEATGAVLASIGAEYQIALSWHPGFSLPVCRVPDVFRDYPVRPLAERIAGQSVLDAANIGAVANTLELEPEAWKTWASDADPLVRHQVTLAQFRRLWHVLVLNGGPRVGVPRDSQKP